MLERLGKSSLVLIDVQKNKVARKFIAKNAAPETSDRLIREAYAKGRLIRTSKSLPSIKELREVCKLVYDWSIDGPIMLAYLLMTAAINTIRNHSYFVSGYLMTLILYSGVRDSEEMTAGVRLACFKFPAKVKDL